MVIRTYFSKNNTLINESEVNTGQNPVAELYYGGETTRYYSRFIFALDLTRVKELYESGFYPTLADMKHTLRMTNTGTFDKQLMGNQTADGKDRSSSFDLVLFPVPDVWDEGVGYDFYEPSSVIMSDNFNIREVPSNWYGPTTNNDWVGGEGVYSGDVTTLATIHFEHGNENINLDITNIVNAHLSGSTATTLSLGLAYTEDLEQHTVPNTGRLQYVGFFTRHTQTFYEPYLETAPVEAIRDDRSNFFLDKDNRLYLYVNLGGRPTNLDSLPTVTVADDQGNVISAMTATQATQGTYFVELNIASDGQNDCTMYTDTWSEVFINGAARPDIELEFSVKSEGYFNIGSDMMDPQQYVFNVTGIKMGENIHRGDVRKVVVQARIPYTVNQSAVIDQLQYRLYAKEGKNQYTVIDYQDINVGFNQNYFLLDTQSLVPNTYYLDIKHESNHEVRIATEAFKFNIVGASELRKSQ